MSYFSPPKPKVFIQREEVVDSLKYAFHKAQEFVDEDKLEHLKKLIEKMLSNGEEDMVWKILTNLSTDQNSKFEEFSNSILDELTRPITKEIKGMEKKITTFVTVMLKLFSRLNNNTWEGTASELLELLMAIPLFAVSTTLPRSPNKLSERLREAIPALLEKGICVEWTKSGDRYIHLSMPGTVKAEQECRDCKLFKDEVARLKEEILKLKIEMAAEKDRMYNSGYANGAANAPGGKNELFYTRSELSKALIRIDELQRANQLVTERLSEREARLGEISKISADTRKFVKIGPSTLRLRLGPAPMSAETKAGADNYLF